MPVIVRRSGVARNPEIRCVARFNKDTRGCPVASLKSPCEIGLIIFFGLPVTFVPVSSRGGGRIVPCRKTTIGNTPPINRRKFICRGRCRQSRRRARDDRRSPGCGCNDRGAKRGGGRSSPSRWNVARSRPHKAAVHGQARRTTRGRTGPQVNVRAMAGLQTGATRTIVSRTALIHAELDTNAAMATAYLADSV